MGTNQRKGDSEMSQKTSRSTTVMQWNDTNSSKLEMSFWQPDISRNEIVPLLSLVPPFPAYQGQEGPFQAGEKVFDYDHKITLSLKEQFAAILYYLAKYVNGTADDLDVQVTVNGKDGYKTVRVYVDDDFPDGAIHAVEVKEGEEISNLLFDFGYEDSQSPDKLLVSINGEESSPYPARLHLFYEFIKGALSVLLQIPTLSASLSSTGGSGGGSNRPAANRPANRPAVPQRSAGRGGFKRRGAGAGKAERSSSPSKVFEEEDEADD